MCSADSADLSVTRILTLCMYNCPPLPLTHREVFTIFIYKNQLIIVDIEYDFRTISMIFTEEIMTDFGVEK